MLIWTTKGPKSAEKLAVKEAPEEAFAESSTAGEPAEEHTEPSKTDPCADVFLDRPSKPEAADAIDDGEWSSAETPGTKSPETTD